MTSDACNNLWRRSHLPRMEIPGLSGDTRADLVVIGGGFTGCSAALEAAQGGARVVLLEAQSIGHGGSGRNVGLVNAGLWLTPDEITKTLGRDVGMRLINALSGAPSLVFDLIEEHAIECEATRNGTLHLAHVDTGVRNLQDRFRQGCRIGAPLQLFDAEATARRTGSTAFHGALFDPRAGTIQPLAYCRGLAAAAVQAGASLFQKSAVTGLRHDGDLWCADVNGYQVRARKLLLATNAYFENIPGLPRPQFVPVHYCQFATAPLNKAQRARILPGGEGCWDTALVMSSLRVDGAGRLIIGGVGNSSGAGAAIHAKWAKRKIAQLYPELAGIPLDYGWEGKIAMTADHIPKVVSVGPRALSVFGYSGRGIGPGTVFGKGAARALLQDTPAALPIEITEAYSEGFKRLRAAYYECGAIVTHALRPGLL